MKNEMYIDLSMYMSVSINGKWQHGFVLEENLPFEPKVGSSFTLDESLDTEIVRELERMSEDEGWGGLFVREIMYRLKRENGELKYIINICLSWTDRGDSVDFYKNINKF